MRPWALESREEQCVFVCKREGNKDRFKEAEGWENWARSSQDMCREQLWIVPQQRPPWPPFCYSRSHSGRLPWGPALCHVWSDTNKQQTNHRGKTFFRLQLTGWPSSTLFSGLAMCLVGFDCVCVCSELWLIWIFCQYNLWLFCNFL